MTLINLFLRARHWHLFALTFGITMVFQIVIMAQMFSGFAYGSEPDLDGILTVFQIIPWISFFYLAIMFGWYWSVAIGLQAKLPENANMKTGKFKWFFFVPLIYLMAFTIFMSVGLTTIFRSLEQGNEPDPGFIIGMIPVIMPLHLFSIFCVFYCLYFVAKTIKTAELQRETAFSDFVGEFFLIWFFPIGIWFIQPKVNQLADSNTDFMS